MIWRLRIYVVALGILAAAVLFGGAVGFMLPRVHYASGVAAIGFYFTALAALQFVVPHSVIDRYVDRPAPRARRR